MNRKIWLMGCILLIVCSFNLYAQDKPEENNFIHPDSSVISGEENTLETKLRLPLPEETPPQEGERLVPFSVGEKFEYSVGWGKVVNAGSAIMEVKEIAQYQGNDVYRIIVDARSNKVFSLFYRVRDKLESLIDVDGIFTRRYWTKQDEAHKKRERKYEFDQENNSVLYKKREYFIRYGIQDEISAVFYARTLDLQVGKPIYIDIFARRKNWQVKCNVVKTETIEVPAGEFETILVEPELRFDGIMKKGKVKIWFTNDERRIPVQVRSKIAIGSILVQLEKYRMGQAVAYNEGMGINDDI